MRISFSHSHDSVFFNIVSFHSAHWLLIFQKQKCRKIYNWSHCTVYGGDGGGDGSDGNNIDDDNVRPIDWIYFASLISQCTRKMVLKFYESVPLVYVNFTICILEKGEKSGWFFLFHFDSAIESHENSHKVQKYDSIEMHSLSDTISNSKCNRNVIQQNRVTSFYYNSNIKIDLIFVLAHFLRFWSQFFCSSKKRDKMKFTEKCFSFSWFYHDDDDILVIRDKKRTHKIWSNILCCLFLVVWNRKSNIAMIVFFFLFWLRCCVVADACNEYKNPFNIL